MTQHGITTNYGHFKVHVDSIWSTFPSSVRDALYELHKTMFEYGVKKFTIWNYPGLPNLDDGVEDVSLPTDDTGGDPPRLIVHYMNGTWEEFSKEHVRRWETRVRNNVGLLIVNFTDGNRMEIPLDNVKGINVHRDGERPTL